MFYELRRYQIEPGRREEWVQYMEEVIIPFQTLKGMVITGSFVDEEDPDGYVWTRRFDDESQRELLYKAVYEDERWVNEIGPVVNSLMLLDQVTVTRMIPTPRSVVR